MKLLSCFFLSLTVILSGCGGKQDHAHELASNAVTQWTERTELFMEYRAVLVKRETPFAVHLTDLQGFKAITEGSVKLIFKDAQGEQVFTAGAPTSPGIFRPIAKLSHAGKYELTLTYSGAFEDSHKIGEVEVYAGMKASPHSHGDEEPSGGISFLKEQQWKGGFNVAKAEEKELFEMVHAQGQLRAPLTQAAAVISPAAGKLTETAGGFPLLGTSVFKDQILGEIQTGGETIPLASPVSGVVSVVRAAPGDTVEEGRKLLDVIDTKNIWVETRVYEPDVSKLNQEISALIEVPETSAQFESSRLVSIGGTLDTVSRTTPVIFEMENKSGLKIGSSVRVHIRTKKSGQGTVVPVSALVDEDGKMVIYVQTEGESFEKREVKLGTREGNLVQVTEGLKPGERVVTEGAYSIRLMSLSSQIPAHGHAH